MQGEAISLAGVARSVSDKITESFTGSLTAAFTDLSDHLTANSKLVIDGYINEIGKLQSKISGLESEITTLQSKNATLQSEKEIKLGELKMEIDQLQADNAQLQTNNTQLEADKIQLEKSAKKDADLFTSQLAANKKIDDAIVDRTQKLAALERQLAEMETKKNQLLIDWTEAATAKAKGAELAKGPAKRPSGSSDVPFDLTESGDEKEPSAKRSKTSPSDQPNQSNLLLPTSQPLQTGANPPRSNLARLLEKYTDATPEPVFRLRQGPGPHDLFEISELPSCLRDALEARKAEWATGTRVRNGSVVNPYWYEDLLDDMKEPRVCLSRRFNMPSGYPEWTVHDKKKYACMRCVNKRLPCCFWDHSSKKIIVLPLHPEMRAPGLSADDEAYWLMHVEKATTKFEGKFRKLFETRPASKKKGEEQANA